MAFSASTILEVWTTGSDTLNGGAFDPSQSAGCNTDGAATVANTASPVFTSASYNFAAGDVGAWVYIASGTNWTPGWYKIASVAANAATLSAAIGAAVISQLVPSTVIGCATTASPTGATWTVDYSQQAAARYTYTDIASSGAGNVIVSVAQPFTKEQVGNSVILAGTNFNSGTYVIVSTAAGAATVAGANTAATGVGALGVGGLGGALASPGKADGLMVSLNSMYIAAGTYTINSNSASVAGGCVNLKAGCRCTGYQSIRGDGGTKPVLQASGLSGVAIVGCVSSCLVENIEVDGNGSTPLNLFALGGTGVGKYLRGRNGAGAASAAMSGGTYFGCEVTGGTCLYGFSNAQCTSCVVHDMATTGFFSSGGYVATNCMAINCTGASSDGFQGGSGNGYFCLDNCTAYGCGRHGFNQFAGTSAPGVIRDCVAVNNSGYGFTATGVVSIGSFEKCAAYNNTSGAFNTTNVPVGRNNPSFITLTASPFTNAAGNDFTSNNAAGGGALLRALALPLTYPGLSTANARDIGAPQHADTPATNIVIMRRTIVR